MTPERKDEILEQWGYTAQWLKAEVIKDYRRRCQEGTACDWLEYLEWEFGMEPEEVGFGEGSEISDT
ncbi:hypothetical protein DPPLL_28130 [Desulfofustis limnaeus]|uniref:Uncharacterized protein n=1 Tax=Desulfofustis limnaeus TaxID=2740163 RepID=A0ABN6M6D3_9BACT|nr:hypothetical protein DPPLL_28130 [Desulfofustis limnaeus]